jgi:hypothetical protein
MDPPGTFIVTVGVEVILKSDMGRIVLAVLVLAAGAWAQTPTGGLTGTVVDQLGARIAGAEIVVAGLSLREVTDLRGGFVARIDDIQLGSRFTVCN